MRSRLSPSTGASLTRPDWCCPNALSCFLEDTLTPAELSLVKMGSTGACATPGWPSNTATVREFCEAVERITGRTVRSFHRSIETAVDGLSVETFIFYPEGKEGPSRAAS